MAAIVSEPLANGIEVLKIDTPLASAAVSLHGGQLIAWQPKCQPEPVLWINPLARYEQGVAIRGGVPICWPWFGPHPSDATASAHGYARIARWQLMSSTTKPNGEIDLLLSMIQDPLIQPAHRIDASLEQRLVIGETLTIELTTTNSGSKDFVMTEALHAYFKVGDIARIAVSGLDTCEYVDTAAGGRRGKQDGDIRFSDRVDRVYLNTSSVCAVRDPDLKRTIKIVKSGSLSTVVWNPGLETATSISDLGPVGWRSMVCVESANALDNALILKPGEQHTLSVAYQLDSD